MLRGDNIVCGTTTTGTGTLTLAATPVPPGGVDFDVWVRATGMGFGNSSVSLVSYTIIEYTDTTFSTAKATEKGIGTLTLGASSGIANATLARTTKQTSATSLNSPPATQNFAPATGISIGTAANTLIFIGASAADIPAFEPYVQTTTGQSNVGVLPMMTSTGQNMQTSGGLVSGDRFFVPFIWNCPMLVKRCSIYVITADAGNSNCDMRLYAMGTDGRPSKLLYDFGLVGSSNASFISIGWAQTGAAGNGFFLCPGEYWMEACMTFTNAPKLGIHLAGAVYSARTGVNSTGALQTCFFSTGGTIGAAPDPAAPASWTFFAGYEYVFGMSPT